MINTINAINTPLNSALEQCYPLPDTVEPLLSVGSQLFAKGCYEEASCALNIAFTVLSNPSMEACIAASKQLQMGYESLICHHASEGSRHQEATNIDLYQEDECDVGPRVLMTPARLDDSVSSNYRPLLEATVIFNKALVSQALCQFSEAKRLYQSVLLVLRNVFASPTALPSHLLMVLGMRAENNLGYIHYCEGNESLSLLNFESSLFFAKKLVNLSNDLQLEYADILSNKCRVSWMRGDVSDTLCQNLRELLQIR